MPYTALFRAYVFLNGDYKGCYQLSDQIERGKDRINIEKLDSTVNTMPNISGGYIVEIDAYAGYEPVAFYSSINSTPVTVKYPDQDDILIEQYEYIKSHFDLLEETLYSANFNDKTYGYHKYLDIETFLKHFIVGELSGNTDTYWSTYLYKFRNNDKFFVGPVWDFDIAFENDYRTYPINDNPHYIYRSVGSRATGMLNFVDQIMSDSFAAKRLTEIWGYARDNNYITEDNLNNFIDSLAHELDRSQTLNFMRWDIMNSLIHMNPRIHGSYKSEVDNIKHYLSNRILWMDNKVNYNNTTSTLNCFDQFAYVENRNLIFKDLEEDFEYRIYNYSGQLIFQGKTNSELKKRNLVSGIYICVIFNTDNNTAFKFYVP